ncbi:ATP-binding protein, partial [Candidatus Woesebacteria bacterium]|nr:ATP-binding protein [Candidatus Woesebacteria bacterium]
EDGKTILLTTHDIDDANQLCDRVAIMNYGKIVAIDSPEKLKNTIESVSSVEVAFSKKVNPAKFKGKYISRSEKIGDKIKLYTMDPEKVIFDLVEYSKNNNNNIVSLNTLKPNLEDVFIKLTEQNN